jgi:hypothetical protein
LQRADVLEVQRRDYVLPLFDQHFTAKPSSYASLTRGSYDLRLIPDFVRRSRLLRLGGTDTWVPLERFHIKFQPESSMR